MAYRKNTNTVIFTYENWRFIFDTQTKDCRCFDTSEIFNVLDQLGNDRSISLPNCNDDEGLLLEELEKEGFLTVTDEG